MQLSDTLPRDCCIIASLTAATTVRHAVTQLEIIVVITCRGRDDSCVDKVILCIYVIVHTLKRKQLELSPSKFQCW